MATIAILASGGDPQADRVRGELAARGLAVVAIDTGAFPESETLSLSADGLYRGHEKLPNPDAVYLRGLAVHPLIPRFNEAFAGNARQVIALCDEKRGLLEAVIRRWEHGGARVVNTLAANAQHSHKPFQLDLLQRAGVPVPRWIATNDPTTVERFHKETGPLVYKPVSGGATARPLTEEDRDPERLADLALAPVLFQERVEGETIRAYIVGEKVVAAAAMRSEELDYRTGETEVIPLALPPDDIALCVGAAKVCGMPFSGIDLIRGTAGTCILECNPSPMFAAFEKLTGSDIAGPLVGLLSMGGRPSSGAG